MVVPQRLTYGSPAMAKEVTQTVTKPMSVKKITIAEEISTAAIATELKTESQLISITANNHDSNGKASKKTYELMIIDAITENDPRRKGISFALIKKFIKGKYQIEGEISSYIKKAFEKLSNKGSVERVSGSSGISGSIRLTKDHVESVKKQQKLAAKPKPKNPKQTKKQLKTKPKKEDKDTNNNNKKKGHASKVKPTPHAKLNTKKTAITKTKLARSGGKVRLSIATVADPMPSTNGKTTKTKMKAPKTSTAEKPAKTNGQKKPKPTKVRND